MAEKFDQEIEAIGTVLAALQPLPPEGRQSVLNYVLGRLGVELGVPERGHHEAEPNTHAGEAAPAAATNTPKSGAVHILDFKNEKRPRSANEMAALVAYYLENVAPEAQRKDRITTKDIETQFKIAEFPLPGSSRMTLVNAKAAGYFDGVGSGEYKLNAIGHNLVAHSMPRGSGTLTSPKRRAGKKGVAKKPSRSKR